MSLSLRSSWPRAASSDRKRAKVVNFTVVANRPSAVRRVPGLDGPFPINYLQALGAEVVPIIAECLSHLASRCDRIQHRVKDRRVRVRPNDEGDTAHIENLSLPTLSISELGVVSGLQFVARKRIDAQMPRLTLVDNIELACLLPFNKKPCKQIVPVESAEPLHFHIARVSDTVRTWQHGGVTERAETTLVLDATYNAGHPETRGTWRQRRGDLASDLVDNGDNYRPRTCKTQPGRPRTAPGPPAAAPSPEHGRATRPAGAVLELQHLGRPKRREIHQFSRAQHIDVGNERNRPRPPCRVDLRK